MNSPAKADENYTYTEVPPPAVGSLPVLTKDQLQTQMSERIAIKWICANSQNYHPTCPASGAGSTAGSKRSGISGIAPDSSGAGGGPGSAMPFVSLENGASMNGNGFMGSPSQSMTVNVSSNAIHVAEDYYIPSSVSSGADCPTCGSGGSGGGDAGVNGGGVLDFMMIRQDRSRDQTEQSSFGAGGFGSYDLKLHMNSDEVGDIDVFDPSDLTPSRLLGATNSMYNVMNSRTLRDQLFASDSDPTESSGKYTFSSLQMGQSGSDGNDPANGVFTRELHGVIKQLIMLDLNGAPTGLRANAAKAIITNFDGVKFEFEVFQTEDVPGGAGDSTSSTNGCGPEPQQSDYSTYEDFYSAWDSWYMCEMNSYYGGGGGGGGGGTSSTVDNDLYDARLTKVIDRNGKSLSISYKSWTPAQLAESPERQWQIDTVTDAKGRVATFSYGAQQVGGRWAISQIQTPDGGTIQYEYAGAKLSHVVRPGGSESTFSTTYDSDIQHVKKDYTDPVADGGNRDKEVWLTSNFVEVTHSGAPSGFYNQASQLVRAVINGDDSVGFLALSGIASGAYDQWVYEGGGTVKRLINYVESKYATGWELRVNSTDNHLEFACQYESKYATAYGFPGDWGSAGAWNFNRPDGTTLADGLRVEYEYDAAGFTNKIVFGDGTYETAEYNDLHQVTRHRDRSARVTKYTYDTKGNRLTKEVGILEITTTTNDPNDPYGMGSGGTTTVSDVNQPEHAIYTWEYYPVGHATAGLLKTEFDPLWGGSSPDTHRTDYEYNGGGQLTKKLASASVTGQQRPETNYTYNTNRQLVAVVSPDGHTTQYAYDLANRLVKTTYDDSSTEETLYGAGGTPQDGLVVKTKDRRNVVTSYTYDLMGRATQVIVASAWDNNILDGQPDDTPITDHRSQ